MIGVKVGEVSIEVTTVAELAMLVGSPEFKQIAAILKNGTHKPEGNGQAPAPKAKRVANGEKAPRETVVGLIRQGSSLKDIASRTGWSNKQVAQLRWYLKNKTRNGSDGLESIAD